MEKPRHRPPGTATGHPKRKHKIQRETGDRTIGWGSYVRSKLSGLRFPLEFYALGRAAIAMAAVRSGAS